MPFSTVPSARLRARLGAWTLGALAATALLVGGPHTAAPASPSPASVANAAVVAPAAPVHLVSEAAADTVDVEVTPVASPAEVATFLAEGRASYYGRELAGRRTASGERFDPADYTAAHRTLPFGTRVRVTNLRNDKTVIVRVNDRGPFHRSRIIDISRAASDAIGMTRAGTATVRLERMPAERGVRG